MSHEAPSFNESEYQKQIEVFGAERMSALLGNEATEESTNQLLQVIQVLAQEPGAIKSLGEGIHNHSYKTPDGDEIFVLFNTSDTVRRFAHEKDSAFGVISGLDGHFEHVFIPRGSLSPAIYHVAEDMYINREDGKVKILKQFVPRHRGIVSSLLASHAQGLSATKLASEAEVQDTIAFLGEVLSYNDRLPKRTPTYGL